MERDLLDVRVLSQHGPFHRLMRWWRGIHPEKGVITRGWTGWETVEVIDRIIPSVILEVRDVPSGSDVHT